MVNGHVIHTGNCGIRPLVKLPADARVVEQDGVWKIRGVATTEAQAALYGDKVNYSANGIEDWKLFLNDGTNVYLIASDYVPNSSISSSTDLTVNGNYGVNVGAPSAWSAESVLRNTAYWSEFAKGFVDATATGGPTLGQFVQSYNGKYGTNYSSNIGQGDLFISNITDSLYYCKNPGNLIGYWLSTAYSNDNSSLWYVNIKYYPYAGPCSTAFWQPDMGIRPLIKLPQNAGMTWNGSSWDLSS